MKKIELKGRIGNTPVEVLDDQISFKLITSSKINNREQQDPLHIMIIAFKEPSLKKPLVKNTKIHLFGNFSYAGYEIDGEYMIPKLIVKAHTMRLWN